MDPDRERENGGRNNAAALAVLRSPDPADPQTKEEQPCTWLRAAPYIVALLAGVALFVVGVSLEVRSYLLGAYSENIIKPDPACTLGISVLSMTGGILAAAATVACMVVNSECNPRYRPRRLDQADD